MFRRAPSPGMFLLPDADALVTREFLRPKEIEAPLPKGSHRKRADQVTARICVDTAGKPRSVTILRSGDPDFAANVRRAVMTWRFEPAKLRGQVIPACGLEGFTFEVSNRW
jgi:TonB family protein